MAEPRGRHRSQVSDYRDDEQPQSGQRNGSYQHPRYQAGHSAAQFDHHREPVPAGTAQARMQPAPALDRRPMRGSTEEPPERGSHPRLASAAIAILIVAANLVALAGIRLPYIGPALGFWFIVVFPAYLLYTTSIWGGSRGAERVGYSVTAVILLLMVGGLTINTILPHLGVARPLDTVPVVILGDVLNACLYRFRLRRRAKFSWLAHIRGLMPSETRLILTGLLCVPLAVLGANRLNNGVGDQVALAALACVIVTVLVMLGRNRRLHDRVISVTLYFVSLALLLMISLRGWYVTGGDIQSEYRFFQLTEAHGRWSMSVAPHSAYNACLSITILPTEISRVVNVDNVYIFTVFFQLLVALVPVLAYTMWRRYASKLVALTAVIYFIGFPVYITGLPGVNRQEIAFLFVCAAALAVTNARWSQGWRRLAVMAAAVGVELSHYSTMYMFIGTLAVAWILGALVKLLSRRRSRRERAGEESPWTTAGQTIGLGSVLVAISIMLLWGGLATQTAGPIVTDVRTAISQFGHSSAATPYSLLSRTTLSPQQILDNYRSASLRQNESTPGNVYFPPATVARYGTPLDNEPNMPSTSLGRLLSRVGISASTLNTDVRQGAAKDEQLFIILGFIVFIFVRSLRRRVSGELLCLAAGSIFMVVLFTIFPNFSVDYNASRALQEGFIWAAPILVVGSIAVFSAFGQKASIRFAVGVAVAIFISTTGFLPQILGGYQAQLNLDNSGQYYDVDYMHSQEVAAVTWLEGKPGVLPAGLEAQMGPTTSDPFAFNNLANVTATQSVGDIFPALVKRSSWVLLNYSIVRADRAAVWTDGQIVTYRYPTAFLEDNKNLVYNDGGAEIYK
jgi:uncharacterized membrane protein